MPAEVEAKVRQTANKLAKAGKLRIKKGETVEEAKDRYVYATMNKIKANKGGHW